MLLAPLYRDQFLWIVPLLLTSICYVGIFRKLGKPPLPNALPFVGDNRLTKLLFPWQHAFWRPFLTCAILVLAAYYLGPFEGSSTATARVYLVIATFIYHIFLLRLYRRLCKAFGKGIFFALMTWLLPPLGLGILGYSKKVELVSLPDFERRRHNPNVFIRFVKRFYFILVSLVEVAAVLLVVGFFTVRTYPPAIMVESIMADTLNNTADVTGTGDVVAREDVMADGGAGIASLPTSRAKFFPSHDGDESVVVMSYFIGSDLEERMGLCSVNIAQMIESTTKGPHLTYVMEAGGSPRWFTEGIESGSYGRYTIANGKLEKVADLPKDTCMSEPQQLSDFIAWAKENYPADRYMLVLWDHGGGLSAGYGYDQQNKREADVPLLSVTELADAIDKAGVTFDVIGFDACLMQNIETAAALEPYADYFIASEETEGGYGWLYTSAFGKLAADPTLPTEDFARELIACYDPYNTIINSGEPDTVATLSLVDLPLAKAAYQQMEGFFGDADVAVREDSANFAHISLAGTKAYSFTGDEQVDLVDFLSRLHQLDASDRIFTDEEANQLIEAVRASVIMRNGNSAEGINGLAVTMPVKSIDSYSLSHDQLKSLSFDTQRTLYDDFFSIIAAQKKKAVEAAEASDGSEDEDEESLLASLEALLSVDYTQEDWYVEGFEDYEPEELLVDIPLAEVEDGYRIELPEKTWDLITESRVIAYQRAEDGTLRYLGMDDTGSEDADGRPLVAFDGTWVRVAGRPVCYESEAARTTKKGVVFTGTVKARLNGEDDIKLHVEWDPVPADGSGTEAPVGRIKGYTYDNQEDVIAILDALGFDAEGLLARGMEKLSAGDRVDFMFDYYDDEGNLVKTESYGRTMIVTSEEKVTVTDEPLGSGQVVFGGVLTDAYQRTFATEKIEAEL